MTCNKLVSMVTRWLISYYIFFQLIVQVFNQLTRDCQTINRIFFVEVREISIDYLAFHNIVEETSLERLVTCIHCIHVLVKVGLEIHILSFQSNTLLPLYFYW